MGVSQLGMMLQFVVQLQAGFLRLGTVGRKSVIQELFPFRDLLHSPLSSLPGGLQGCLQV